MADRHRIQVLRKAGLPVARVAEQLGVSPRSVVRIAQEPRIASLGSGPAPAFRPHRQATSLRQPHLAGIGTRLV